MFLFGVFGWRGIIVKGPSLLLQLNIHVYGIGSCLWLLDCAFVFIYTSCCGSSWLGELSEVSLFSKNQKYQAPSSITFILDVITLPCCHT